MNIKLIFVFTICVVLPNEMCLSRVKMDYSQLYRAQLVEFWKPNNFTNNAIRTDKEGNIFMYLAVLPKQEKNGIFVLKVRRIGVYIARKEGVGTAEVNNELINYLVKILGVPKFALEIVAGRDRTWKTVQLTVRNLTVIEVLRKLSFESHPSF